MHRNEFGSFIIEAIKNLYGFESSPIYSVGNDSVYFDIAVRHHIIFCLDSYLKKSKSPGAQSLTRVVEQRALIEASHHLRVHRTLSLICKSFGEHKIDFLLYKGFALQARFYDGRPRLSGDIDIILEPELIGDAVQILATIGGQHTQLEDFGRKVSVVNLQGITIELHPMLVEPHIALLPHPRTLLEKKQTITFGPEITLSTLSDMHHLLALLVHGFKHQWCRLLWVLDIALMLKRLGADAVPALLENARIYNVERIAVVGMALATEIFSVEIGLPRLTTMERNLVNFYRNRIFERGHGIAFKMENLGLHLAGLQNNHRRILYLRGRGNGKLQTARAA